VLNLLQGRANIGYYTAKKGGAMTREQAIEMIRSAASNNRLTCEKAHALSEELRMPLAEIGLLCNELKIRISACQLGCF
jgi:hypothetical protein